MVKNLKTNVAIILSIVMLFIGCAGMNKTATQQISEQTTDPVVISTASYADALDIYNTLAGKYLQYQSYVERTHPELNAEVLHMFMEMNNVLNDWKFYRNLGKQPDSSELKSFEELRHLIVQVIIELEEE